MTKSGRILFDNVHSYDEPDRMPVNIIVTNLDIMMYVVAIVGHFVDLTLDINVAVRYFLVQMISEFWWTLVFILLPAFVNTAVSIRMYAQDKQQHSLSNEFTKRKSLRIFILMLQMAPILRFADALIYAVKSRRAERKQDIASQRLYYRLMLKEDSDAALLRIFECFLEAAPQLVLQTTLLLKHTEVLTVHKLLSMASSIIGMGWCLAAYQRAIRYAQENKSNMTWSGTVLQTLWHFLVSLSRVTAISAIAYLFPYWTVLACFIHITTTALLLQIFDRSSFCSHNQVADIAFSFALGGVYLFTYILPVEGKTRYRYSIYYSVAFVQNIVCGCLWFFYVSDDWKYSIFFLPILVLSILPFVLGIIIMIIYYRYFHPQVNTSDTSVSFKASEGSTNIS